MKVGMMLPTMHSVALNEQALRGFEALGLDSAWLPDHLLGLYHGELWAELEMASVVPDSDAWLDPFVLGGVLGPTTSLTLGTSVTDGTRRRGPDLARAATTLNHACPGGFILGIGSGEAESILPFGWDFTRPVAVLERCLAEMRSLFDTGRMPDGGLGRLAVPEQSGGELPEIWVAAHGPRMLDLTGRYADGWLPTALDADAY